MKAEDISRILKMNREGALTDEQAAELLAELAKKEPASGRSGPWDWSRTGLVEPVLSTVNSTLKHALDATFGWHRDSGARGEGSGSDAHSGTGYKGSAFGNDPLRNAVHMSRFDQPEGHDHVFTGNSLRMSSVTDLRLIAAEMKDNTIDMSKVDAISVKDGKLNDCEIRASSVEDWKVDKASVIGISVQGSKFADFHCFAESIVQNFRLQAASVKDFKVEGGKIVNVLVNGASISDFSLARSELTGSEIQASSLTDLSFASSVAENLMLRAMSVRKTALERCDFRDVVFTCIEKWAWKKQGLRDMRFVDCRFEKVLFANCRMHGVVLKNLDFQDRKFRDFELSGKEIDGNEAFLKAIGENA